MTIRIYTLFSFFSLSLSVCGQSTNTISGGLNDNEVNVVRDGDFSEDAGGVIKMVPKGKKEKVMTIVADSLDGKPVGSSSVSTVPNDSTIQFKNNQTKKPESVNRPANKGNAPKAKKTKPK